MLIRITVAVHSPDLREQFRVILARPDILVQVPGVRKDLWERILKEPSDVLIINQSLLPTPMKDKIRELNAIIDSPTVVMLSESTDPIEHAKLIAEGCDAVMYVGLAIAQVCDVIEAMLEKRKRNLQNLFFTPQPLAKPLLADFVSKSPGMADFMNLVPRVVQSDTTLLIEGETGVGKERLAAAIHAEGPRSAERFVALNCGALPEPLLESELFGHVKGAFTGAMAPRRGWFEVAHMGTIFLDEIGELPLHLQVKLLRVLQEHEIQPIGGEKSFKVDVRVIAAGNRPLALEVESGRFRKDLYHRLSVATVTIPPLRSRVEDIPTLVARHIAHLTRNMGRKVKGISQQAIQALCGYAWPGNVRELNNVIERAILLADNSEISLDDLPEVISARFKMGENQCTTSPTRAQQVTQNHVTQEEVPGAQKPEPNSTHLMQLPEQWLATPLSVMRDTFLSDLEKQYIEGLLTATRGRIGEAAKRAGIPERSLYEKMQLFNLHKEDFKKLGALDAQV